MSDFVAEITDTKWDSEVLGAEQPVLVDFWAPWCGPCRQMAPSFEAIAEKYKGKAKFFKLNVDENLDSSARYGVRGIPTLILFRNGAEAERAVGLQTRDAIAGMVERQINPKTAV